MRLRTWTLLVGLTLSMLWTSNVAAQGRGDVIKELVPPPRMILRHQEELGLTAKQKKELKTIIKDAQSNSLDLEFKVQEEAEKLAKLIGAQKINLDKSLKQADLLMAAESKLKRVKLEMMLKTRMLLTQSQLKKIEEFKAKKKEERKERRKRRLAD